MKLKTGARVVEPEDLRGYRTAEPLKSIVFPVSEKVSFYFAADAAVAEQPVIILGARGCDLEALAVCDLVLASGELADQYYQARRAQLTLIGTDCTDCGKTCFCTMVGGRPYPRQLFDLNLSPIEGGYIVEVGTEKGAKIVAENQPLFAAATREQLANKDQGRSKVEQQVRAQNQQYTCRGTVDWSEAHKINLQNQAAWRQITKDCVECSGCNFVCPTCTCFLLLDQAENGDNGRYKVWDGCLKNGYARVAGGGNSRPKLFERLQNRYHCKFDYSFDRLGRYACVGCGRCINGCAGNIDMRKVYAELVRQVPLSAHLE